MALDTVGDYVDAARELLQDQQSVKRFTDGELISALGFAMQEARKLRPDLFLDTLNTTNIPDIKSSTPKSTTVPIDVMYRMPFLYYMVGHAYLRDEEEGADARASGFKAAFNAKLLSLT